MKTKANLARVIVAVFAIALLQGPICSNVCATELCPDPAQHRTEHSCDQNSAHHSHQSGHQKPAKRDCSQRQHPQILLGNAGNISQSQLAGAHQFVAAAVPANLAQSIVLNTASSETFDTGRLPGPGSTLHDRITVLRI
jgi:hypothetical protein